MQDGAFYQIIADENLASVFYEDAFTPGLMTISPATTRHAMIIPFQHASYLADMDENTGRHYGQSCNGLPLLFVNQV